MKRTLLMVFTALLLLTQCRKSSVNPPIAEEGNTVSMTVTVGLGRTNISEAGAITWSENDKLYVSDGTKYIGCLTLNSGADTQTGTFIGTVVADDDNYTFHFFYLGSVDYATTLTKGASKTVDIDFSSQTGRREDLSRCHVGHGSATGKVSDGNVILDSTDPVTMTSKVAIAYLEFKKGDADYNDALILGGTHIYSAMTVGFGGTFTGKTVGPISITGTTSAQKYVMLVPPASVAEETLYFGGAGVTGSTTLYRGIEANKLYRMADGGPIGVSVVDAYVDLGLSVKWATINLGAESPEGYGDYYAWGATTTWYSAGGQTSSPTWKDGYSDGYSWAHCPYTNGIYSSSNKAVFTKYVPSSQASTYGYGGYSDEFTTLQPADDAATATWGGSWRMPTEAEFNELKDATKTTRVWTDNYNGTGVKGYVVTSIVAGHAGNSLFLPAAGYRNGTSLANPGAYGHYWSSSLYTFQPFSARCMTLYEGYFSMTNAYMRRSGMCVRPVRASQN